MPAITSAAVVMLAVLGSLGTGWLLHATVGAPDQFVVLAVVLALTLRRVRPSGVRESATAAVELVLVTGIATLTARLLVDVPWAGGVLVTAGLSVGILARRYPPAVRRAGRLVALPFIALLVTPAPVVDGRPLPLAWALAAAGVGLAWNLAVAPLLPDAGSAVEPTSTPTRRRFDAPTRMAVQMALGVGTAFLLGHLLFGRHWGWTVLSAFLVASGNRGRGDVVHKAGLRVMGALGGTVLASLAVAPLGAGHRGTLVALFAVLFVGLVLRERSYAWWAVAVTAIVALLHAYYGEGGTSELADRVLGVLVGSAIAVAVAWYVLPIRTADVLRRRLFDCLAALTDALGDDAPDAPQRYDGCRARLEELVPTLRSHRSVVARRPAQHPLDAVVALRRLDPPAGARERRRLRAQTVWVRRSAAGREAGPAPQLVAELATVHRVLRGAGGP